MIKQAYIGNSLDLCIRQGRWQLGERLPSERALAQEFNISRGTLRTVLQSFVGKGILEVRAGSGIYLKALPQLKKGHATEIDYYKNVETFAVLMRVLVKDAIHSCTIEQINTLEQCLQEVGIAVLTCNVWHFSEGQRRFFHALLLHFSNSHMSDLVLQTLPPSRIMAHILAKQEATILNQFFVLMAQMLTAYRRADSLEAERVVQDYMVALLGLADKKSLTGKNVSGPQFGPQSDPWSDSQEFSDRP